MKVKKLYLACILLFGYLSGKAQTDSLSKISPGMKQVIQKQVKKDSLPEMNTGITGIKLRYEFGIMNAPLPYQSTPLQFSRIYVEPEFNLMGIKLNSAIQLSTEDLLNGRNMNLFTFSLDRNSVMQKLISASRKSEYFRQLDSLEECYRSCTNQVASLNSKQQSSRYLEELRKAEKNLRRAAEDSVYAQRHKSDLDKSRMVFEKGERERKLHDSLNLIKEKLENSIQFLHAVLNKGIKDNPINPDRLGNNYPGKDKILAKHKRELNRIRQLSYVRNLRLMDVYPSLSTLGYYGFALRGADLDWCNGRNYFSVTAGFINTAQSTKPFLNTKATHAGFRFGWGDPDKISGGILFAASGYQDSTGLTNSHEVNYLTGIQTQIRITESHKVSAERLYSTDTRHGESEKGLIRDLFSGVLQPSANSATQILYTGYVEQTATNIQATYQRVDPFFFSIANPYLRKDSERSSASLDQLLLHNRLKLTGGYAFTRDNISGYKSSSTYIHDANTGFQIRFGKNSFRYGYRTIKSDNSKLAIYTTTYISTATYITTGKLFKLSNTLALMANRVSILLNSENTNTTTSITLNETLILPLNIQVLLTGMYRNQTGKATESADSATAWMASGGMALPISKSMQLTSRYNWQKNPGEIYRQGISTGLTIRISNSISGNLTYQAQWYLPNQSSSIKEYHSGRVGILCYFNSRKTQVSIKNKSIK